MRTRDYNNTQTIFINTTRSLDYQIQAGPYYVQDFLQVPEAGDGVRCFFVPEEEIVGRVLYKKGQKPLLKKVVFPHISNDPGLGQIFMVMSFLDICKTMHRLKDATYEHIKAGLFEFYNIKDETPPNS